MKGEGSDLMIKTAHFLRITFFPLGVLMNTKDSPPEKNDRYKILYIIFRMWIPGLEALH